VKLPGLPLCLLVLWPAAAAAEPEVARFAVVIGNNHAEGSSAQSLRYADDDAVATDRMLRDAGVHSQLLVTLDEDSRRLHPDLVPDGAPRVSDLDRALASAEAGIRDAAAGGASTELLLFYSGHGDVDAGEGYLVLEDGRLTRTQLYAVLSRSPATENHVFVDACKSYFMAFEKGPGGRRSSYASSFAGEAVPARLGNTGFVLSTSSDHDSHEWERFQGGILSHEVRSALRGAADADGDGRITYGELGAFLATANRDIPNPRFRPDIMVRAPGGHLREIVFAWRSPVTSLRIEPGALGHVYVETAHGERVLDAHPAAKQALTVHLPSERPLFVRSNDERFEYVLASTDPASVGALAPSQAEVTRRGALHLAFEQLFASPFGEESVTAYERAPARETDIVITFEPGPSRARRRLGLAGAAVAIGATAGGLALDVVALVQSQRAGGMSQKGIASLNQQITRLDQASIACYAVGLAGALLWGGTRLWPGTTVAPAPAFDAHERGLSFVLQRRF
jgi:hypothetical protein